MYTLTPVLAYHITITVFLALSLVLTFLQFGFNAIIEFAFISNLDPGNTYLHALGVVWYCTWGIGLVVIIPLYYVSIYHMERYLREGKDPIFEELRVKVNVKKNEGGRFVLIPGFKKMDSIEIVSA